VGMKRIVCASPKGGSGKTTLARNLAASAAAMGLQVATADLDPQRTLTRWWNRRGKKERPITHYEVTYDDADALAEDGSIDPCDVVFMDTPPSVEANPEPIRRLLDAANFVVVPVRPSLDDAESAVPFMALLRRRKRPATFVLNAVKPRVNIIAVKSYLVKAGDLCPVEIGDRTDYMRGAEHGVGVADLGDHPGAREMAGVWSFIHGRLWGICDVAA
jgi:chromosome partitioning protein